MTFMGANLSAVHMTRQALHDLSAERDDLVKQAGRIEHGGEQAAQELESQMRARTETSIAALLAGKQPEIPTPAELERLRQLQATSQATEPARQGLLAKVAALDEQITKLTADLSGAVWTATSEMQAEARQELESLYPALAEVLSKLLAIESVRSRYAGGPLTFKSLASARPWSGKVVVDNFVRAIPEILASPLLGLNTIERASEAIVDVLSKKIGE